METITLPKQQPFLRHLEELRRRILRLGLWIFLGTAVALSFSSQILSWFLTPVGHVVFLSPAEPLMVHLKVAFLGGLLLSLPLVAWEVWGFVSPAFFPWERKLVLILVPLSAGLFLLGAAFGWAVLVPTALKIFFAFGSEQMSPLLSANSYIGFAGWIMVACGLFFQMPIVVWALAWLKVIPPLAFLKQWRLAIVGILILAAALTPTPDVFSQLLLALPMSGLYLISVGIAFWVAR